MNAKGRTGIIVAGRPGKPKEFAACLSTLCPSYRDSTVYALLPDPETPEEWRLADALEECPDLVTLAVQRHTQTPRLWNLGVRQALQDGCDFIVIADPRVRFAAEDMDSLFHAALYFKKKGAVLVSAAGETRSRSGAVFSGGLGLYAFGLLPERHSAVGEFREDAPDIEAVTSAYAERAIHAGYPAWRAEAKATKAVLRMG